MRDFSTYITRVVYSSIFKNVILICIILNTVTLGIASMLQDNRNFLQILDAIDSWFLAIYILEFILKVYCLGRGYWFNGFNIFDFLLLSVSLTKWVFPESKAKVVQVMRSLRALRPLRTISLVSGVQVVTTAFAATFTGPFMYIIGLLLMIMFVYAIFGFYVFGYEEGIFTDICSHNITSDPPICYWRDFGSTWLSLFVLMTAESWPRVEKTLVSFQYSKFYIISYIIIAHFIVTNLFVAVIIEQIAEANVGYQKKIDVKNTTVIVRKRNKAKHAQESEIKHLLDKQKSLDFKTFPRVVLDMYRHMRMDEFMIVVGTRGNMLWVETMNQEYDRMVKCNNKIRVYHRECTKILADLLNGMDESVQSALKEQDARERMLLGFEHHRKGMSFLRRMSRRTTIASFRPFRNSILGRMVSRQHIASDASESYNHSEESLLPRWCVTCISNLSNCRCVNPELEAPEEIMNIQEEEQRTNETGHRLSALTRKWLDDQHVHKNREASDSVASNQTCPIFGNDWRTGQNDSPF